MHKLLPRAACFIDAAASRPLLSSHMPAPRLACPLLAARPSANPSRLGPPPWLRCAGARRGLCSVGAARRGDDAEDEEQRVAGEGGGRIAPERRQRGRGDAAMGSGELLAIPGVGPRNLRKLVDKGFDGLAQLKQLYRDKDFLISRDLKNLQSE